MERSFKAPDVRLANIPHDIPNIVALTLEVLVK